MPLRPAGGWNRCRVTGERGGWGGRAWAASPGVVAARVTRPNVCLVPASAAWAVVRPDRASATCFAAALVAPPRQPHRDGAGLQVVSFALGDQP